MQASTASRHSGMMKKLSGLDQEILYKLTVPSALFAGSFLLYFATAARHPGWVDATLILSLVRNRTLGAWANVHNLFFLAGLAAQILWSSNYFIWDMYAFALPVYVMLGIPLSAGIDAFRSSFPDFQIVDAPIVADGSLRIYEIRRRKAGK